MKRYNNILFFDFFIIILILGVVTFFKNQKNFSEIENRYLERTPRLNIVSYYKGIYQENLEKSLADQLLYSEEIKTNYNKLFNLSNTFKRNICVDEYINIGESRYLYGCTGHIVFDPISKPNLSYDDYNSFFEHYSKLNDMSDVYYYIIDTSSIYDFKKNKYTYNLAQSYKNKLKGNYTLESFKFKDFNEYSKYFYKTDHHWNYKGSYKGYKEIMKMLGEKNIIKPQEKYIFKNIEYYGSHSQQTRFFGSYDKFKVYIFDIPEHDTYIDGVKGTYGNKNTGMNDSIKQKNMNMYADYYGYDYGEVIFDFHNPEKENLLIISNSFDNAIDELIASHFNRTHTLDMRYYKKEDKEELNIKDYLEDNNISKVLVISDYFFLNDNIKIRLE